MRDEPASGEAIPGGPPSRPWPMSLLPRYDVRVDAIKLEGERVDDTALARLAHIDEVRGLALSDTAITDAGLPHLKGLTNLVFLSLANTRVTPAGVAELKKALPHLFIDR